MKNVALIHYMPLEYYPPVTNMLDSLGNQSNLRIKVWTTRNIKNRPTYTNTKITQIIRLIFPRPEYNKLYRLFTYIWFNLRTFLGLIVFNPRVVIYYESYSAGPIYWYFRFFGKNKSLFIHYHEYFEKAWYDQGMSIVRQYYKYENEFLWQRAQWISHTNAFRRDLFLEEYPSLKESKVHIMPNYPPEEWKAIKRSNILESVPPPLKAVYIGSLSLEHTFLHEFCTWIIAQDGAVVFDIFAFNCSADTKAYLRALKTDFIHYHESGIPYQDIPKILGDYDVGVILYKATTPNAKYCASNKLFEYLICDLEVWVSKEQEGTHPYENNTSRPRVKILDFTNLKSTFITDYFKSKTLPYSKVDYSFSTATNAFIQAITSAAP